MNIKRMIINRFEDIDFCELSFNSKHSVLFGRNSDSIVKAIAVVLKSNIIKGVPMPKISPDTYIYAEIEICEEICSVSARGSPDGESFIYAANDGFYSRISQSAEEDEMSFFFGNKIYSNKFNEYKDPLYFYKKYEFTKKTCGIGDTSVFRKNIRQYFITDKKMSEYQNFLNINAFWQSIEKVRDFNHEYFPVFIVGTEEGIDFQQYIKKAEFLNRQIIICI